MSRLVLKSWSTRRSAYWSALLSVLAVVGCTDPILRPIDAGSDDGGRDTGVFRDARIDAEVDAEVDGAQDAGPACSGTLRECDGDPTTECETDVSSNDANCGGCAVQCIMGASCQRGRCRNGGWVDMWPCATGDVRIRALSLDGQHLIAMGHVPSVCSPLGQTPLGEIDWAVARYAAETGSRDPSWVARYGSSEVDIALAGGTVESRSVMGGICRGGVDFGGGPVMVGAVSGCLAEFTSDGVFRDLRVITGSAGENIEAALPLAGGGSVAAGTSRSASIEVGGGCPALDGDGGDAEIFVVRYAGDGSCEWARRYPSTMPDDVTGDEEVGGIAADDAGNLYLAASTRGTVTLDTARAASGTDVAIFSLDPTGGLRWVEVISSSGDDLAGPVAFGDGSVFVGLTLGGGVELAGDAYAPADDSDAVVLRLDGSTGRPVWAVYLEGDSTERVLGLAYDPVRDQLIASGEFGAGLAAADLRIAMRSARSEGIDAWAVLFEASTGAPLELMTFGGTLADRAEAVVVDPGGAVYMSGRFRGPTVFPDGIERNGATLAGGNDGFVLRWEPE